MATKKATTKTPRTKAASPKARPKAALKKASAKKLSQIEAAIRVLGTSKEPMTCQAMVEAMAKQGLWTSPGGATPHATLYASILREINTKGRDARFKKVARGQFTLAAGK